MNTLLGAVQTRYKKCFDMSLRNQPTLKLGYNFYVDRQPTLKAKKEKNDETKLKLLPQMIEPVQIFAVVSHIVTVVKDAVPNVVSTYRVSPASGPKRTDANDSPPTEHRKTHREHHAGM